MLVREGTHAKYHYLICGVQGDFTRSLVNNPPTHVWTRQLKVSGLISSKMTFADPLFIVAVCGSIAYVYVVQEGYPCLYRHRSRSRALYVSPGTTCGVPVP